MSTDYKELSTPKFCPKISHQLRRKHRRKRENDIRTWIRNRTSSIDFGKKIKNKKGKEHPIHCNKNNDVRQFYWQLEMGCGKPYLDRIRNIDFDAHFNGFETFYYAGSHGRRYTLTLVNIDIDCKKFGTRDGAMAFAEFLKQNVFPDMYYEVSTNGNGVHGYIVLDKFDAGERFVNDALLSRLDPYLKQLLRESDFDVENVEIKGTAPVFEWGDHKYELNGYKSGVLAKIPRVDTPAKQRALKETTYIHINDLLRIDMPRKEAGSSNQALSLSGTGVPIKQEDLDDFYLYLDVAKALIGDDLLRTSDRRVVRAVDVACFLLLGKCFTENMNKDGSMPRNRFKSVQGSLFANNFIQRAFNGKRFKVY